MMQQTLSLAHFTLTTYATKDTSWYHTLILQLPLLITYITF